MKKLFKPCVSLALLEQLATILQIVPLSHSLGIQCGTLLTETTYRGKSERERLPRTIFGNVFFFQFQAEDI